MKSRITNLESLCKNLKPFLPQYLQEHGIDTTKNFKCLNPKHDDSNPSMSCKQIPEQAYCFSCGKSVDIFSAASILEGKPEKGKGWMEENVLYLAKKYNVPIPEIELTPEEIYEYKTYQAYKLAYELVSDPSFGDYSLADQEIQRREWDKDKVASWGIGTVNYADFRARLKTAGYDAKFIDGIDLGRSNLFDNFNLIFTVFDDERRPVGFSARRLDDKGPKYTNTATTGLECSIFKKGERLYGFDVAKDAQSPLYIFEGQANVITLRHHGHLNCCCTMGTAFTDHHITLLKKHGIFNILFVYDGDEAGQIALENVLDNKFKNERDFRIKVATLPIGKDPDDFVRENGYAAFARLIKKTAFQWRIERTINTLGEDPSEEELLELSNNLLPLIVLEPNHIEQERMSKEVSRMTGINLSTILSEVKRRRDEKEQEIANKKQAAIDVLMRDVKRNPDDAELALAECQVRISDINKSTDTQKEETSTLNFLNFMKETDENKSGEFEGFYFRPETLGALQYRFNGNWKKGKLFFLGGSEQSGKCQKFDTKLPLPTGEYKTIEEVVQDKIPYVLGMDTDKKIRPMKVKNWIDSGPLRCFKVSTDNGIYTEPSETHPYYTLDGWKQVKDLKVGDKIAIARNYDCFNNLSSPISEEDSIILGGLLSDGSITDSFGFSNTDEELLDYFKSKVEKKWENVSYRYRNNTLYVTDPNSTNSRMLDWLRGYNLFKLNAHDKFIPEEIFKCNLKRIGKFLGMFWACDGWISFDSENNDRFEIGITLCNYNLLKQIRSLLLRFAIKSKIRETVVKLNGKEFQAYSLSIRDIENAKKFYNNINIPLERKQEKLKAILDSNKKHIGSYGDNFPPEIIDRIKKKTAENGWTFNHLLTLIGEDRNYFAYDKSKDRFKETPIWRPEANTRNAFGSHSLGITPRKLNLIGHVLNDQFLIDIATGDIYFDKIASIEDIGEHQCYDLEVDHPDHNFIAEDTVVHNTSLAAQFAYEIASNPKNNAMCIYHSIDDAKDTIAKKWVCNATNGFELFQNAVGNPNYWEKEYPGIKKEREKGYQALLKLVNDNRLVVKDVSDGGTLAYILTVVRFYREMYPERNILLFVDNFHKLPDLGEMQGQERTRRLCNYIKASAIREDLTIVATAEYRKLQVGEKPSNSALSNSAALQYDADVIIHLYNDKHIKGEASAFVHFDKEGNCLPRVAATIAKNKITGEEVEEYFNLFSKNSKFVLCDKELAIKEWAERSQELEQGGRIKLYNGD